MDTQVVEATNGTNWGRFLLGWFTEDEWRMRSEIDQRPILTPWNRSSFWMMDLVTGEAAFFTPGGFAAADLRKRRVWVCPMFEPALTRIYALLAAGEDIPSVIHLTEQEAPSALYGYRRPGPGVAEAEDESEDHPHSAAS